MFGRVLLRPDLLFIDEGTKNPLTWITVPYLDKKKFTKDHMIHIVPRNAKGGLELAYLSIIQCNIAPGVFFLSNRPKNLDK